MAAQGFFSQHWSDASENPAGGVTTGRGFTISWQNGPLVREGVRHEPNGAFVEDVISAVIDRIQCYERSKFACNENQMALQHLEAAINSLQSRTRNREARGVEGTLGV